MKIFDISLDLSEKLVTYPGDRKFSIKQVLDLEEDDSVNLSEIHMSVHTGTHVDAPNHFIRNSDSITDININRFFGEAKVYDFTSKEISSGIDKLDLINLNIKKDNIVLFKTRNSKLRMYDSSFEKEAVYLTQEGASYLVSKRIKAVGIDYLSIGKYRDDEKTHKILLKHNIVIYEGLNLENINSGSYLFYGFPLKIKDCEGAPVRAILASESND